MLEMKNTIETVLGILCMWGAEMLQFSKSSVNSTTEIFTAKLPGLISYNHIAQYQPPTMYAYGAPEIKKFQIFC